MAVTVAAWRAPLLEQLSKGSSGWGDKIRFSARKLELD